MEEKIKMAEQKRRQLRQKKEEALEAVEEKIKMKRAEDNWVLTWVKDINYYPHQSKAFRNAFAFLWILSRVLITIYIYKNQKHFVMSCIELEQ